MKQKQSKIMVFAAIAALCLTGCKGGDADGSKADTQDTVAIAPQPKTPGKYPQGSERMLTKDDLQGLSAEELKIMRNEIFARHGFKFTTEAMQSYFATQNWYTPQYDDVNSMLTDIEKANIPVIQAQEAGGEEAIKEAVRAKRFSPSFKRFGDKIASYQEFSLYDFGGFSEDEIRSVKPTKVTITSSTTATVKVRVSAQSPEGPEHWNTTLKMIKSGNKWYIDDMYDLRKKWKEPNY